MGKRKEESVSKSGGHKRLRQEDADKYDDEPNEAEHSHLASGSNSCSQLVSYKL